MATINTTFSFRDQMSAGLNHIDGTLKNLNSTLLQMSVNLERTNTGMNDTTRSSSGLFTKLINFNQVTQIFQTVKGGIDAISRSISECSSLYNFQIEQETKLEQVMRKHMKASEEQIQMIKDTASAQQKAGIYGDEMQLAGLQELATYVDDAETLKELAPILNSMLAQGVGTNATARDMQSYATMLGKVMQGQVGGMSKRGYKFTDAEEQILKTGTEMQKLAVLQNAVIGNFGDMNQALAQTPQGQMMQLNNQIGDLKENIGKTLSSFKQTTGLLRSKIQMKWLTMLNDGLKWATENMDKLKIAILGVITAMTTLIALYAVYHKAQLLEIATRLKNIAVMVAEWAVAHAKMILIIGVIMAVIAGITLLLMYSEKTFPAIGGLIGGLAGIAREAGRQMQYYMQKPIEMIVNGFITMKNKVINAFLTMFDYLLKGVSNVAEALDKVFGTTYSANIQGFRNDLQRMKNTEKPNFSLGWKDERVGFENAWRSGKTSGELAGTRASERLQNWLGKEQSKVKGLIPNQDLGQAIEEGIEGTFKVSGGTLSVEDKNMVSIADDYRELLSKRATERFNLQYKNVTPSVNISSMNINNGMDEDAIISRIGEGLSEMANSSLGVAS